MKPLYNQAQFNNAKFDEKLPCECLQCHNVFYRKKHKIKQNSNPKEKRTSEFCSRKCSALNKQTKLEISCGNCNKNILKTPARIKHSKSGKNFCCQSCATTYMNTHKAHGYKRSKLEIWLESKLTSTYPNLKILFNNVSTIGSELDIYFPELKLAFELNGIFHYEPIYGDNTLNSIKNRDNNKFQSCLKNNIGLCIIDTSGQKYFKEQTSQKFLDIIVDIISKNKF